MIITITFTVNEKNTRTTQQGKKVASTKLYPLDIYAGGIFLPDFVNFGDTITVSGQIKTQEYNGKPQYNFSFPTIDKLQTFDNNTQSTNNTKDLFGGTEVDISDDALPF